MRQSLRLQPGIEGLGQPSTIGGRPSSTNTRLFMSILGGFKINVCGPLIAHRLRPRNKHKKCSYICVMTVIFASVCIEHGVLQSRHSNRVTDALHMAFNYKKMYGFSVAAQSHVLISATMSTLLPHTRLLAIWRARGLRVA